MNDILKYILDAGLVAPIAVITMTLVYYFDLDKLLLPIQVVGMCGMLLNLCWLIYEKKREWIIKKERFDNTFSIINNRIWSRSVHS